SAAHSPSPAVRPATGASTTTGCSMTPSCSNLTSTPWDSRCCPRRDCGAHDDGADAPDPRVTEESIEPIPAATVVLARDCADGIEVLMLRRSSRGAFGGMWVFPGGRVENDDVDPAAPGDELGTARRAAVREAKEEADVRV